jgi:regulator of RNase E activity RraA
MTLSDAALLAAYAELDSAAVSDALDALELPTGQAGFLPVWGHPKIVGLAVTVQLEPYVPGPSGAHIGSSAVAAATDEDVIVVNNEGRTDVSCWGGLLSLGAALNGVRGVVADGACRDVNEARELSFPVFAKGRIPTTARGRLQQRSTGEPVKLGDVAVTQGDVVFADETGVVVVPRECAEEVLGKAQAVAERERGIAADLRVGISLHEAMRDARLAGTTEQH